MASQAEYFQTSITGTCRIATANTNRTGGTYDTVGAMELLARGAAGQGSVIRWIHAKAEGTTTAGQVRLWVEKRASGLRTLLDEIAIAAATVSATVQASVGDWLPPLADGFRLEEGDGIFASTHNAEGFTVTASGVKP